LAIRPETAADFRAIDTVVQEAFGSRVEVDLVHGIRGSQNYVPELALVAERDGKIIGHTMLSYVALDDAGQRRHRVLSLSPLAVLPDAQQQGIGSALIAEAVRRADERAEPLIVLEGSPEYYARFGFKYAPTYGISIDLPSWARKESAMVYPLSAYGPHVKGHVVYPPAFHPAAHASDADDLAM
jgi:putative acetyltransferase